jgi:hypothetical protein
VRLPPVICLRVVSRWTPMRNARSEHPRYGPRLPCCQKPVGTIENKLPKILVFLCPACGNRWSAEEPGARKQ